MNVLHSGNGGGGRSSWQHWQLNQQLTTTEMQPSPMKALALNVTLCKTLLRADMWNVNNF